MVKYEKHSPMYYFSILESALERSSVTIYNYIMIMQGKDYVILSFFINILRLYN